MARLMRIRPPPEPIAAPPAEVERRMRDAILEIRSVWFPTRNELQDWTETRSPLYVRWLGDHRFEIGPRLANMWAACFSPVLRGSLVEHPQGTRLEWATQLPRITLWVQAFWAVLLAFWLVALTSEVQAGGRSTGVFGFWLLLAMSLVASSVVGRAMGGRALERSVPWLIGVASTQPVDEDW